MALKGHEYADKEKCWELGTYLPKNLQLWQQLQDVFDEHSSFLWTPRETSKV